MIAIYFDDSGTHDSSKAVVAAGYLATVDAWERFQPAWQAVLDEYRIPYFHMTEFEARKKLFTGWSNEKRIALQRKHTLFQCFGGVRDWANREGYPCPIDYIFSQRAANGELEILRQRIFKDPKLKRDFRIGTWTIGDMRKLNPLQAADIIAFETYKEMDNYIVPNKEVWPRRKSMEELIKGADVFNCYFYEGNFMALQAPQIWADH